MKQYFYCQSYQMLNYANYVRSKEDIVVISSAENVIKACKEIGMDFVQHNNFSKRELIIQKNKVIKSINQLVQTIGNAELHFSHTQFAVYCFLLVDRMIKKKKRVIFHDFEFVYDELRKHKLSKRYIIVFLIKMVLKRLYNLPLEIRDANGALPISFNIEYIRINVSEFINEKNSYFQKTLDGFKKKGLKLTSLGSIFIDQGFGLRKYYKQKELSKVMDIIKKQKIEIKPHPKLRSTYLDGYENKLPEYIPVEFYFSSVNNCVISCHSSSLITATYFDDLKVISLIDIIGVKTDFMNKVKRYLIKNGNGRIMFPKNVSEFECLIK